MEFYDYYFKLFKDANDKLRKSWGIKLKVMKQCRKQQKYVLKNEPIPQNL